MEANEVMFTSLLGLRDSYHHMILLINTLMQIHTRSPSSSLYSSLVNHLSSLLSLISYYYFMQWVSHRNHRGNICGVDFVWLLNPNKYRKLHETSWSEAVYGMFKVRKFVLQLFSIHITMNLYMVSG